mgnify:CR=1 FL=1
MIDTVVARRYANAIFALGKKEGEAALSSHGECLAALGKLLATAPGLDVTLKSPVIGVEEKKAVLDKLLDEAKGIVRGQCITAVQLSADKQSKLKDTLQKKAGTDIELTFAVDKDILGGMVLKMGDRVLDASLRAQLGILRETFKRGE